MTMHRTRFGALPARRLLAAAAALALAAPLAHAASWMECAGNKIKWNGNWTAMYISTTSFPAYSSWDYDLQTAMYRWNAVGGSGFNFYYGRDTDGTHSSSNGVNEIYFSNTEVGTALAVTFSRYHCYWLFGYQYGRDEADIAFNSNYAWNTGTLSYANLGSPYNFEGVALHELGHALGLGHSDGVQATMNSYYPNGGSVGYYKEFDPLPDDRYGERVLYPDGTYEADVAGSAFQRTGAGTSGLVSSPTWAYRGTWINIGVTFMNMGTTTQTFGIGFYLSTDGWTAAPDRWLGSNYGAWLTTGGLLTFTRSLYIPADIAPGTYTIGFRVDNGNAIGEDNEYNNVQPMPRTITIY